MWVYNNVCICTRTCMYMYITTYVLCIQNMAYMESGKSKVFSAMDYMAVTPDWAVFGHSQRGFDPQETRWYRKKPNKDIGGC